jgi:predicted Fe-Mo cluster-binding NifX family protein
MKTAFAASNDHIAETPGSSQTVLLLENGVIHAIPRPARCNFLQLLQQNNVDTLVCNKIGCCLLELLQQHNIKVIAGISGSTEQVIADYLQNRLRPGRNFTCTENGRICGDCTGNF